MTNVSSWAPLRRPPSAEFECLSLKVCLFTFHWTNAAVAVAVADDVCVCVCVRPLELNAKEEEEEGFLNSEFDFSSLCDGEATDGDGLSAG